MLRMAVFTNPQHVENTENGSGYSRVNKLPAKCFVNMVTRHWISAAYRAPLLSTSIKSGVAVAPSLGILTNGPDDAGRGHGP